MHTIVFTKGFLECLVSSVCPQDIPTLELITKQYRGAFSTFCERTIISRNNYILGSHYTNSNGFAKTM